MNDVFAANGPKPNAVASVAKVAMREDRQTGAADTEVDGRPHDERENGKGEHVEANRNEGQIAKDDEACRHEQRDERS